MRNRRCVWLNDVNAPVFRQYPNIHSHRACFYFGRIKGVQELGHFIYHVMSLQVPRPLAGGNELQSRAGHDLVQPLHGLADHHQRRLITRCKNDGRRFERPLIQRSERGCEMRKVPRRLQTCKLPEIGRSIVERLFVSLFDCLHPAGSTCRIRKI